MPAPRPALAWARPLSAVSLFAAAALAPALPALTATASAAAKPEITVTPSENLADGGEISVRGSGFTPGTLLFVAVCDTAKPLGGSCDTGNYSKATTGDDGSLSTKLKVVQVFGDTDCAKTSCALMTNDPANPRDTRNFVTVPLTFAGGTSGAPTAASTPAGQAAPAAREDDGGSGGMLLAAGAVALLIVAGVVVFLVRRGRPASAGR
ncbi:neocarzinostatin apoprotein domain-containing protein [Spirillospora sp. NPDC048819]|uniref:neocarzinostatin apoprotein domain-containing protein n=1 Tax=Spirillospora sp. NPDC048819 TaxID=3155268 RepID=UPI0033F2D47D